MVFRGCMFPLSCRLRRARTGPNGRLPGACHTSDCLADCFKVGCFFIAVRVEVVEPIGQHFCDSGRALAAPCLQHIAGSGARLAFTVRSGKKAMQGRGISAVSLGFGYCPGWRIAGAVCHGRCGVLCWRRCWARHALMLEPFGNKRAGCHAFTRRPRGPGLGGYVRLDYCVLEKQ